MNDIQIKDPIYGKIDSFTDPITGKSVVRIVVLPHILDGILKKEGFPVKKCIKDFRANGWLLSDEKGNNPRDTVDDGVKTARRRVYEISKEQSEVINRIMTFEEM